MRYGVPLRKGSLLAILFITGFFIVIFAAPFLLLQRIPGDYGDPLFNLYVLEHVYQWVMGKVTGDLFSPPMFYPYPHTLFFSDTHVGSEFFYGIFRAIGFSPLHSFTLWFLVGYFITLFATYCVLLSLGFTALASAVGAAIFAFSLPSLAQMTHPQLVYRFCIPICLYYAWQMLHTDVLKNFLMMLIWFCMQTLVSVYLGVFLAIQLAAFLITYFVLKLIRTRTWVIFHLPLANASGSARIIALGFLAAFLTLCTISLLLGYYHTAAEYNLTRNWGEIQTMIPRPGSYLIMDYLPYWKYTQNYFFGPFSDIPMRHEHNLFMGLGPLLLFIIGIFSVTKVREVSEFSVTILWSLLAILLCITTFDGVTIYKLFGQAPGISALRAISRFVVALMFQVSVICAVGVEYLQKRNGSNKWKTLVLVVALGFTLFEFASMKFETSPIRPIQERINSLVRSAEAAARGVTQPILQLVDFDERPPLYLNLEAILAAQQLGWPAVSGYSGFSVATTDELTCSRATEQFYSFAEWNKTRGSGTQVTPEDLLSRTITVGKLHCPKAPATSGAPPSETIAPDVVLSAASLSPGDNRRIILSVRVANKSDDRISAWSSNPVRLSWRFQKQGATEQESWPTRLGLGGDVLPKSEIIVPIAAEIPKEPGNYDAYVSLVSEHKFWFHDKGMQILVIRDALKINEAGDVSLRGLE